MRTELRRFGRTLTAGSAMVILAACGSTPTPTAPAEAVVAEKATSTGAAAAPVSVTVRGSVVDSSNRQLANITIECLGDVQCTGPNYQVIAEGHDHRVGTTDTNGRFEVVATSRSGASASGFLMNANGRGYEVQWRQIEWPDLACSADQARCALTVNFMLPSVAD
jgi:hypothetical protein